MVTHSGTPTRTPDLRPLNQPRPIIVAAQDRQPTELTIGDRTHAIVRLQDTWIIEDEWWRTPINRQYFQILLDNGHMMTIFLNRIDMTWWAQEY